MFLESAPQLQALFLLQLVCLQLVLAAQNETRASYLLLILEGMKTQYLYIENNESTEMKGGCTSGPKPKVEKTAKQIPDITSLNGWSAFLASIPKTNV